MLLEKCDGPACPRCGCQDCDIRVSPKQEAKAGPDLVAKYGVNNWFATGRARCRNCALVFAFREVSAQAMTNDEARMTNDLPKSVPADVPLPFPVRQCPRCGSTNLKVTSTRKPLRHHKCLDCESQGKPATFKSLESL